MKTNFITIVWADIIIVSIVAILLALIIYFYIINRRKNGACANCSEVKRHKRAGSKLVDEYHKKYKCEDKNCEYNKKGADLK